jgi:2-methylcitrate dehydratase
MAAFANSVATRYLDYNDTYLTISPSHPSDMILPIIATGEAIKEDGKSIITAVTLAYEVLCSLTDATDMWERGWDYPSLVALSTALAVAKLMNLSRNQIENTIGLALCPNVALRQSRVGAMSDWKVCASPDACRNGIVAALLAERGMTGPLEPFLGKMGFCTQVSGNLNLEPFGGGNGRHFKLLETSLKLFPACYFTQTAIEAALELRKEIENLDQIAEIVIEAGFRTIDDTADVPDKWQPDNLFTANNSLPYTIAVALMDGTVGAHQFSSHHFQDRRLNRLVRSVQVRENDQFSKAPSDANPVLLKITTDSGVCYSKQITYAKGHPRNPAPDREVETKFVNLVCGPIPEDRAELILKGLWQFEQTRHLEKIFNLFSMFS